MKVDGKDTRPIWLDAESRLVNVIDQRALPHELVVLELQTVDRSRLRGGFRRPARWGGYLFRRLS